MQNLTWVEISQEALANNIRNFRAIVDKKVLLCPCVKANAYGHGLVETGKILLDNGADWLAVNALYEARALRAGGVLSPLYVLGYIALSDLAEAEELDVRMVVYNKDSIARLGEIGRPVKIHIKVETGNNRQGVLLEELMDFAKFAMSFENIEIEGLTTHFANIEDTTDHSYAKMQMARFEEACKLMESAGARIKLRHCANSAATILFQKTHFEMVRVGIASYGMWPSNETYVSFLKEGGGNVGGGDGSTSGIGASQANFELMAAFTWKTRIAQIKTIAAGEYIGYGCTYRAGHETRLAILPVGYYDGYDRGVNGGYVLIHGKRAPLRGRICMNIIMVEVTDIPEARLEDEVVLIGRSGTEEITAEQFAAWAGTINYEVTTRVNERIPRIVV